MLLALPFLFYRHFSLAKIKACGPIAVGCSGPNDIKVLIKTIVFSVVSNSLDVKAAASVLADEGVQAIKGIQLLIADLIQVRKTRRGGVGEGKEESTGCHAIHILARMRICADPCTRFRCGHHRHDSKLQRTTTLFRTARPRSTHTQRKQHRYTRNSSLFPPHPLCVPLRSLCTPPHPRCVLHSMTARQPYFIVTNSTL